MNPLRVCDTLRACFEQFAKRLLTRFEPTPKSLVVLKEGPRLWGGLGWSFFESAELPPEWAADACILYPPEGFSLSLHRCPHHDLLVDWQ